MCNAIRDIQLCNSSFATDNNRRIPLHLHPPTPIHLDATLALPLQSACRGSRGLCNTPIIRVVGPLQCHSAIGLEGTCQGQMGAHEGVPDACLSRGHQRGGGEKLTRPEISFLEILESVRVAISASVVFAWLITIDWSVHLRIYFIRVFTHAFLSYQLSLWLYFFIRFPVYFSLFLDYLINDLKIYIFTQHKHCIQNITFI